LLRNTILQ
jgi:GTPase SAR1 family protein